MHHLAKWEVVVRFSKLAFDFIVYLLNFFAIILPYKEENIFLKIGEFMLITPRTLSGFKDRLPKEAIAKSNLLKKIIEVFDSFGFNPIETPHLEYAEILLKQGSDEIQKELYAFKDHGGRDVALRFDLTLPLARFISQHRHALQLPFKRYAIGNVFRGERAQKGRYREFTQCDFDFVGSNSIASDAEIIQVIAKVLQKLEVGKFTISINHRLILNGICEYLGITDVNNTLRIVDKLDKIGVDGVCAELEESLGYSKECIHSLLDLISLSQEGKSRDFLQKVSYLKEKNQSLQKGLDDLQKLCEILDFVGLDCYKINFSIARGLGYYTGIVYESTLDELSGIGSVCSGGRYDNLTQTFCKEPMSGVGASVGLDRLLSALEELGKLSEKETRARVLCVAMSESYMPYLQKIASNLRDEGIATEVYPDITKLKKPFSYADTKGHPYVLIVGEDEFKEERVTLKNMQSGNQESLRFAEVIERVGEG